MNAGIWRTAVAAMLLGMFFSSGASAQDRRRDTPAPPVSFQHTAPKAEALPYPGQAMTLTVRLKNTKDTDRRMILSLVKDGRLMQVNAKDGYLNEYDLPTYEIGVSAPVAEMSYQFMLLGPDSSVMVSPRYFVQRTCIPSLDLADPDIAEGMQGYSRLQQLVNTSSSLQNDLNGYDRLMVILDELQKRINK